MKITIALIVIAFDFLMFGFGLLNPSVATIDLYFFGLLLFANSLISYMSYENYISREYIAHFSNILTSAFFLQFILVGNYGSIKVMSFFTSVNILISTMIAFKNFTKSMRLR